MTTTAADKATQKSITLAQRSMHQTNSLCALVRARVPSTGQRWEVAMKAAGLLPCPFYAGIEKGRRKLEESRSHASIEAGERLMAAAAASITSKART